MSILPVLPVAIPLLTAALSVALWSRPRIRRTVDVVGATALLVAAIVLLVRVNEVGVVAMNIGGWPAPFAITLAADLLSALMVLLAGITGLAVVVYGQAEVDPRRHRFGHATFLHVMLAGICGSFVTTDLFNLYVWFEVMLIGSFVLLVLGGERRQMEGGMKYVVLNLVGSSLFLAAAGGIYGTAKTLNFADLSGRLVELAGTHPHVVTALASILLVAFGIKAGLFPLYSWLPPSYPTPPAAVSAIFAGLLTKVGVYVLLRVFVLVFPAMERTYQILLVLSCLTMVIGVLGAVAQFEIRKILSFHIVSQIGYMVAALGLMVTGDPTLQRLAIAAAIFYIGHHIIVKTNLFLVGGVVNRMRGTYDLARLGGLASAAPWLGVLFLVPALSLAGIPPLSGFWAKLAVVRAGLAAGQGWVVAAALVAGLMTLISMFKIWIEAFWKPAPEDDDRPVPRGKLLIMAIPIAALGLITIAVGLFPQVLFDLAERASDQLLHPEAYVRLVGGRG
jgi:multicomponent Na+:H+ antiporter subunit D